MYICDKFITCGTVNSKSCLHNILHEPDMHNSNCMTLYCDGKSGICRKIDEILFNILNEKLGLSKKQVLSKIVLSKLRSNNG